MFQIFIPMKSINSLVF